MIDTAVHAVALRLDAGSTAATVTCHVAAIAFFSALMLASLDGRFG